MDPGNPMGRLFYLWVLVLNERTDEALKLNGGYAEESRRSLAGETAALFVQALEESGASHYVPNDPVTPEQCTSDIFPRLLAHVHVLCGDADGAVRWLRVAVERGFTNYLYLARHDRILRRLDDHDGFRRLLEDVRQRCEAFDD